MNIALDEAVLELERRGDVVGGSVMVVREKRFQDNVVAAVTYRRRLHDDVRRASVGLSWSPKHGWHAAGGAWAGTASDGPARGIWLDWGGWGGGSSGLRVRSGWLAYPEAHTLVATDAAGRVLEDLVENGVAILGWRGDWNENHANAELRDAEGRILTSEPLLPRQHRLGE